MSRAVCTRRDARPSPSHPKLREDEILGHATLPTPGLHTGIHLAHKEHVVSNRVRAVRVFCHCHLDNKHSFANQYTQAKACIQTKQYIKQIIKPNVYFFTINVRVVNKHCHIINVLRTFEKHSQYIRFTVQVV